MTPKVHQIIDMLLASYNEGKDRKPLDLVLYRFFNEQLLKVHRIMKTRHSHLLVVAHKGSGVASLTRIASYVQNA